MFLLSSFLSVSSTINLTFAISCLYFSVSMSFNTEKTLTAFNSVVSKVPLNNDTPHDKSISIDSPIPL